METEGEKKGSLVFQIDAEEDKPTWFPQFD
jgi:hypothetical protein